METNDLIKFLEVQSKRLKVDIDRAFEFGASTMNPAREFKDVDNNIKKIRSIINNLDKESPINKTCFLIIQDIRTILSMRGMDRRMSQYRQKIYDGLSTLQKELDEYLNVDDTLDDDISTDIETSDVLENVNKNKHIKNFTLFQESLKNK